MVSFRKKIREQTGGPAKQQGTYLAAGSQLEGNFSFSGPCVIACQINGRIETSDLLVIEKAAEIDGDIHGTNVIVHGKVMGDILATASVELGTSSVVEGNIRSPGLKVAEGAQCLASVQITRDAQVANVAPAVPAIANTSNVTPIEQAKPGVPQVAAASAGPRRHGFLTTKI